MARCSTNKLPTATCLCSHGWFQQLGRRCFPSPPQNNWSMLRRSGACACAMPRIGCRLAPVGSFEDSYVQGRPFYSHRARVSRGHYRADGSVSRIAAPRAGCISEAAARFLPDYEAERCSKIGTGRRTNLLLREFANPRDPCLCNERGDVRGFIGLCRLDRGGCWEDGKSFLFSVWLGHCLGKAARDQEHTRCLFFLSEATVAGLHHCC